MKKLYILSICTLITALTYAQPVDYTVTVTQVQWFEGGVFGPCWENGTEEYTALVWFDDNLNGTNTGGTCITCDNNGNCTNNTEFTLGTRTNTCAETVNLIFQAWEDDGTRCTEQGGDDCDCGPSTVASVTFQNSGPGCTTYGYYGCNTGNHRFLVEICWDYTTPPPPNTDCAGAIVVGGGSTNYTLPETCGTDITSCTTNDANELWYEYTAPCDYAATFSTCGSSYDTALSLWTSCTTGEIACNDDVCGLQSSITTNVTAGTTYYIRVSGFNGATGSGVLNISDPTPTNDECADAIAIGAGTTNFDSSCATGTDISSCTTNDIASIWYTYTNTSSCQISNVEINTFGSGFDTSISGFDACGGNELA